MRFWIIVAATVPAAAWTVKLEEPTGIYRREGEVVTVRIPKRVTAVRVWDEQGREVEAQAAGEEVLFRASVVPGERPRYRVAEGKGQEWPSDIMVRELGRSRVEFANSRFGVIVALAPEPAIVEAYSKTAAPERQVNLVETTPPDPGWKTEPPIGAVARMEVIEKGPLRARVRVGGWEFEWRSGSAVLTWRAPGAQAFVFHAVSALPYEPFNRFVHGGENDWPQGWEPGEPPEPQIGERKYQKLPGGHGVYYRREENYGALGIFAERVQGIGSARFRVTGAQEVGLSFPRWDGDKTVLEARHEYRVYLQPIVADITEDGEGQKPQPAAGYLESLSLDGEWELGWVEKGNRPREWRKVRVPGTVHVQWLEEGEWFTPRADWVSGKEWWFRKRFRAPDWASRRRVRLQFEATDYYADAWLNGKYLGRHEGYIDPYEYEVELAAENLLEVRVWTPVSYYWRHRPWTAKGSYGAVDQKPDNITALGITRSVRVVGGGPVVLRDWAVATRLLDGGAAEVEVNLELDGPGGWEVDLELGGEHTARVTTRRSAVSLRIEKPRLWWTWDHGTPYLYRLTATVRHAGQVSDRRSMRVGIREIEKVGWTFYLNRKRMFVRGTNYYYGHLFLSELDRRSYERDVALMRGMNVNMIRLHCHFANREFYDLADEQGILVWQDYLEAWYPHDREFALRAAALYEPLIRYVRNHPSVAVWATSDEEDLENYRVLTKHLAGKLYGLDPQRRPVVRSTGRYGDAHVYHGWYEGSIWEYAKTEEAFISELGATAIPNYESAVRFLGDAWPIRGNEEKWVFHKLQIPEAMRAWGEPGGLTLREYITKTQAYVARLFQIALERMRRRKYEAGGILHFHAIDFWPSVTMAAVDYYRVPTKVYDTVRRSFEPVAALFEYGRDEWRVGEEVRVRVWAVNDRWEAVPEARIEWEIGEARGQWKVDLPADSTRKLGEVVWQAKKPGDYRLLARVVAGKVLSENMYEFRVAP
jgi:beta-mannosidase